MHAVALALGESWKTRARDGRFDRAVSTPGRYTLVVRREDGTTLEREVDVGEHRVNVELVIP